MPQILLQLIRQVQIVYPVSFGPIQLQPVRLCHLSPPQSPSPVPRPRNFAARTAKECSSEDHSLSSASIAISALITTPFRIQSASLPPSDTNGCCALYISINRK